MLDMISGFMGGGASPVGGMSASSSASSSNDNSFSNAFNYGSSASANGNPNLGYYAAKNGEVAAIPISGTSAINLALIVGGVAVGIMLIKRLK